MAEESKHHCRVIGTPVLYPASTSNLGLKSTLVTKYIFCSFLQSLQEHPEALSQISLLQ
jgi:hypothetical protein